MRARHAGRIINIGSVLGFLPAPYMALYAASKHAIEGYSESLDHEVRTRGVRVSVVEPAYTKTRFDVNMPAADAQLAEYRRQRYGVIETLKEVVATTGDDPNVVAAVVVAAAQDRKPKLRYTAGRLAGRLKLLKRFAPASVLDSGIRKQLQLDAVAGDPL